MKKNYILLLLVLFAVKSFAQGQLEDYRRADTLYKYNELIYGKVLNSGWCSDNKKAWYRVQTSKGKEFMLVDMAKKSKSVLFDQILFAKKLTEKTGNTCKAYQLPFREITLIPEKNQFEFTVDTVKWLFDIKTSTLEKKEIVHNSNKEEPYWGISDDENTGKPVKSPDGKWKAYIKNFNLYISNIESKKEFQLSYDGTDGDYYSCYINWSPDSKKIAVNKLRTAPKRFIYFVQSSPTTQLQPILQKREYLKPGDALPFHRPKLFDVVNKKQIAVDELVFDNQFTLSTPVWHTDNRSFTVEYNQRGHQEYRVDEVNAETGLVKHLITETSKTFVCYTYNYRYDVNDGKEIIWRSERDGWLHLYLVDGLTGEVKNQITKGEWVVREVVNVDEKARQIVFKGSGKNAGEDPYLLHYYSVNFDGSNLIDLTPENGEHDVVWSPDRKYMIDTWSRVDMPHQTVLRDAKDGKILIELEKADISALLKTNWKMPEVFTNKARDNKTDIWGMIVRPTNFDPKKKYPVIEFIYAGPGDNYVPKTFSATSWTLGGLAELGFITVMIDGMGTGNRSRAFQDIIYKNLADAGFPDRIKWIKAAAAKYPYMDTARIGIFGGSAGGQSSTAALLHHPEFYKVAVSTCGCHDNRMDKIWWNELWMGYPVGKEYAECSNVENAAKLKGKLMIMVGEVDDNVDPASTMQLANALIKANKDFELVVIPGESHVHGTPFQERKRRDFFVKNLLNLNPPDWNSK